MKEISLSIEETNKLRASLGLPLLKEDPSPSPKPLVEQKVLAKEEEKTREVTIVGSTLGSESDEDWQEKIGKFKEKRKRIKKEQNVAGEIRVLHNIQDITDQILVLKDSNVLDDEDDSLINYDLMAKNKSRKKLENVPSTIEESNDFFILPGTKSAIPKLSSEPEEPKGISLVVPIQEQADFEEAPIELKKKRKIKFKKREVKREIDIQQSFVDDDELNVSLAKQRRKVVYKRMEREEQPEEMDGINEVELFLSSINPKIEADSPEKMDIDEEKADEIDDTDMMKAEESAGEIQTPEEFDNNEIIVDSLSNVLALLQQRGELGKQKDLTLTYKDEFGRELTQKEAYKQLSHKFHGKGMGKNKREKKLKRMQEERLRLLADSPAAAASVENHPKIPAESLKKEIKSAIPKLQNEVADEPLSVPAPIIPPVQPVHDTLPVLDPPIERKKVQFGLKRKGFNKKQ